MKIENEFKQTPDFLLTNNFIELKKPTSSKRKDYLEIMFFKIKNILEQEFYQSKISSKNAFWQNLDVRIKIITFLYILLTICLTKNLYFLIGIELFLIATILYLGVTLKFFLKRILLAAFLFSGILVIPAIFSFAAAGETLIAITNNVSITKQGTISALFVFTRSLSSLSLAFILLATTRWNDLTAGLSFFKIPNIIITILDFTYRYIFLFLAMLTNHILGRKSRLVNTEKLTSKLNWLGLSVASFFRLSLYYTEEISLAMTARGYNSEIKLKNINKLKNTDIYFSISATAMFLVFLGGLFIGQL
ncbi:cobalt ECF transporter T component CbiQ [Selenomonadales bacterium OttesenSCG-928-I06]|nr:cobalt ECF transporter T component CbiQ [Selenomonadales bacterium OttesenSCG-928-I06]